MELGHDQVIALSGCLVGVILPILASRRPEVAPERKSGISVILQKVIIVLIEPVRALARFGLLRHGHALNLPRIGRGPGASGCRGVDSISVASCIVPCGCSLPCRGLIPTRRHRVARQSRCVQARQTLSARIPCIRRISGLCVRKSRLLAVNTCT
ncbi:hypothetical protein [Martelella sp. HB161492]|uniref:hypothetical protein n=1 Tax=Martelella sp. HB161492 TaxID=2720726 RepID=UPI001590C7D5|nr:hypothetical protein [Martelella sp. HB161492]